MIMKEVLDLRLKLNNKVTVYDGDNIPLTVSKAYNITHSDPSCTLNFEKDCQDLAKFCWLTGLTINPNTKH